MGAVDEGLECVGVLIVRAWREPTAKNSFRARISATVQLGGVPVASTPVAAPGQVLGLVAAWLEGFLAASGAGDALGDATVTP
jgi:hypothetical protein